VLARSWTAIPRCRISRLSRRKRAPLPDGAFALYRLSRASPVHDEAHVKNALARFRQAVFESKVMEFDYEGYVAKEEASLYEAGRRGGG